jgi:hypothetical protein
MVEAWLNLRFYRTAYFSTLANRTHWASSSLAWSKLVGFSSGLFVVFSASSIQGTSSLNKPTEKKVKEYSKRNGLTQQALKILVRDLKKM